jgi:hypothetical protein
MKDEKQIKNLQLFEEVYELIYKVKKFKLETVWRDTVITAGDMGKVKIKRGEAAVQHDKIGLLSVILLSRFHNIEL